jgi:hypothetical protein
MLNSLLVASLMVVSMPTIAAAYCSKPDAPYCAITDLSTISTTLIAVSVRCSLIETTCNRSYPA